MDIQQWTKKALKSRFDKKVALFLEDEFNKNRWKSNREKAILKSYFALNPKVKLKLNEKGIDFNLASDTEITHEKLIEAGFKLGFVSFGSITQKAYCKFSFIVNFRTEERIDGDLEYCEEFFYYNWVGGNTQLKSMQDIDNIHRLLVGDSIYD